MRPTQRPLTIAALAIAGSTACRDRNLDARPDPSPTAPQKSAAPAPPAGWCITPAFSDYDGCYPRKADCEPVAAEYTRRDPDSPRKCVAVTEMFCYGVSHGSGESEDCWSTSAYCEAVLGTFERTTHTGVITTRCHRVP
jgi:hypothetical protein